MTGVIQLAEHAPARLFPLPDAVGRALAASKILDSATPDLFERGRWSLRAGSRVGAVTLGTPDGGTTTVRITPKVPIARLFFLLGYAQDPGKGWREDAVDLAEHTELLPALAHSMERLTDRALRRGLLQGYREVADTSWVVRGRIRESEQMRRRFGAPLPVEIAYDEFTTDIAENRILRAAVERLLRLPGVPRDVRARLLHQRARLADVTVPGRGQRLPRWVPTRLNARYHPALRLARVVLDGSSVEHLAGGVRVDGFLFDMNRIYEDFVCTALREALRPYGGASVLQADDLHLDEGRSVPLRPDLVWYGDSGAPRVVVDAKYKAGRRGGYPNADLYQMLAYCTALGLAEGHLVYAKGNEPRRSHLVQGAGTVLHQHALDLDRQPAELLSEIRGLAGLMAGVPAGGGPRNPGAPL
ncbi:restriction endonuclease [Streptomyces sp. NPDC048659]|uniref:McrC family protein n=1 Tax=Streptomyces sp. NPDC048659 TaxID=3155489 RepID=UPI003412184E